MAGVEVPTRAYVASFGFKGSDQQKLVGVLSGGERNRLNLALTLKQGGNLLLLCGRPAANLVMVVLALCASLYIFDITPAELWQWVCELGGGVHEKGVAVYEQNAARRAERAAARQAEEEAAALEAGEEPEASDDAEEPAGCPAFSAGATR